MLMYILMVLVLMCRVSIGFMVVIMVGLYVGSCFVSVVVMLFVVVGLVM